VDSHAVTLTAFAAQHSLGLTRFAYVLTGDRQLAEDLVQDCLLALHRRFGETLPIEAPVAYAHRMIVNGQVSRNRRPAPRWSSTWCPTWESTPRTCLSMTLPGACLLGPAPRHGQSWWPVAAAVAAVLAVIGIVVAVRHLTADRHEPAEPVIVTRSACTIDPPPSWQHAIAAAQRHDLGVIVLGAAPDGTILVRREGRTTNQTRARFAQRRDRDCPAKPDHQPLRCRG